MKQFIETLVLLVIKHLCQDIGSQVLYSLRPFSWQLCGYKGWHSLLHLQGCSLARQQRPRLLLDHFGLLLVASATIIVVRVFQPFSVTKCIKITQHSATFGLQKSQTLFPLSSLEFQLPLQKGQVHLWAAFHTSLSQNFELQIWKNIGQELFDHTKIVQNTEVHLTLKVQLSSVSSLFLRLVEAHRWPPTRAPSRHLHHPWCQGPRLCGKWEIWRDQHVLDAHPGKYQIGPKKGFEGLCCCYLTCKTASSKLCEARNFFFVSSEMLLGGGTGGISS